VLFRSWTEFIDPDDVERMRQYHYSRRKDPSLAPRRYEARVIDISGVVHNCIVYVDVIAGTANSVASLVDISDLKHAEVALQQINKKLNLMSSITRHDIINQVTAVSGYLELLKQRVSDRDDLAFIQQAETAAMNIEHQITFTGIYQDIGVNSPEWQRVADVVSEAAGQLPHDGVTLETDLEGIEIYADPLLIKVFYNLIDNANRYGEKLTRIRFSYRKTDDGLVLVCSDDGAGIPAGNKEKIFDRGFGRHTGFGLFLAREILSITGLTIQETGVPQEGAQFEIHVPKNGYRIVPRA
jgi:signal transduction histidine kinase